MQDKTRRTINIARLFHLVTRPSVWIAFVFILIGEILYFVSIFKEPPSWLGELTRPRVLAFICFGIGCTAYVYTFFHNRRFKTFSEIDEADRRFSSDYKVESLLSEIKAIPRTEPVDYEKLEQLIQKQLPKEVTPTVETFTSYFYKITRVLEDKARLSDEKASVLLDRGTFYVWVGIVFYLITIVVWQLIMRADNDFHVKYVYGIVSCSLLFIFIEFLSAWFLKQYRHFVDTSTYLLRVKAIFDRYFLLYISVTATEPVLNDQSIKVLSRALNDEIPWPEDRHLTKADTAFAKEALTSLSELLRATKRDRKEEKED